MRCNWSWYYPSDVMQYHIQEVYKWPKACKYLLWIYCSSLLLLWSFHQICNCNTYATSIRYNKSIEGMHVTSHDYLKCVLYVLLCYIWLSCCPWQAYFSSGGEKLLALSEALLKKHISSHSLHEPEGIPADLKCAIYHVIFFFLLT